MNYPLLYSLSSPGSCLEDFRASPFIGNILISINLNNLNNFKHLHHLIVLFS